MRMEGARVWILPNPSGRNRAFTLDRLVEAYRQLYLEVVTVSSGENVVKTLVQ